MASPDGDRQMKIDWPIICAFITVFAMVGLSGQRLENPVTVGLFVIFLIALVGLAIGVLTEILLSNRR